MAYRHDSRKSLLDADPSYEGSYRHRQGLAPPVAPKRQGASIMYMPNTLWTWAFMGTACVQAAIILSLES